MADVQRRDRQPRAGVVRRRGRDVRRRLPRPAARGFCGCCRTRRRRSSTPPPARERPSSTIRRGWRRGSPTSPDPEPPPGVTIEEVRGEDAHRRWAALLREIYQFPPLGEQAWAMPGELTGWEGLPWRQWIAYADGEPAAVALLYPGGGVAGLFGVGARRALRRRGARPARHAAAAQGVGRGAGGLLQHEGRRAAVPQPGLRVARVGRPPARQLRMTSSPFRRPVTTARYARPRRRSAARRLRTRSSISDASACAVRSGCSGSVQTVSSATMPPLVARGAGAGRSRVRRRSARARRRG